MHPLLIALFVPSLALAFPLKRDSTGEVVRWMGTANFIVDSSFSQALSEPAALAAVEGAIAVLDAATPGLRILFTTGTTTGVGYDLRSKASNKNEIVVLADWPFDPGALAVTIVTLDIRTHAIIDADIAFNGGREFRVLGGEEPVGEAPVYDLQNVLTHELGHALGLAHNEANRSSLMYPATSRGETSKRALAAEDGEALLFLYPQGGAEDPSDPWEAGCSASPGPVVLWALVLLAGLVRRGGRRIGLLAALLPALASAAAPRSAEAAAQEMLADAKVLSAQTRTDAPGGIWTTELELEVSRCLRGTCPQRLVVTLFGGRRGDLEQVVQGTKVPREGETVEVASDPQPRADSRRVRLRRHSALDPAAPRLRCGHP